MERGREVKKTSERGRRRGGERRRTLGGRGRWRCRERERKKSAEAASEDAKIRPLCILLLLTGSG